MKQPLDGRWLKMLALIPLLSLAVACDPAPRRLTEPESIGVLSLPLRATIDSHFIRQAALSPRTTVTITSVGVLVDEANRPESPRNYRLELSSSAAPGAVADAGRLLLRTPGSPRFDEAMPCKLRPGVYNIVEPASGLTVGILIVYPDCRMEVYTG